MKVAVQASPVQRRTSTEAARAAVLPNGHWYCSAIGTACSLIPDLPSAVCSAIVGCCNNI